jgi:hypothetical protein
MTLPRVLGGIVPDHLIHAGTTLTTDIDMGENMIEIVEEVVIITNCHVGAHLAMIKHDMILEKFGTMSNQKIYLIKLLKI